MKVPEHFGFYGILTNPLTGYENLAKEMVNQKVKLIQLRMKDSPREEILTTALALRKIIKGDSIFIVNDDPLIALEAKADGVHLGQDDMPYPEARAILGDDAIIGLSTHNPGQTKNACALGPDYIGIGPVFPTPTKKTPDPPIGLDGMQAMLAHATVPAVVLGSIDDTNIGKVVGAGARNICCVRYVNQSSDPKQELKRIFELIEESSNG